MNIIKGIKIKTNHIYINNNIIIVTIIRLKKNNFKKKYYNKTNLIKNNNKKIIIKNNRIILIKNLICFSKGKGFCGTIKRFKFSSNRASHGNSKAHNKPGSIGMCQTPGRILKGKKMAGRMGNNKKTIYYPKIIYYKKSIIIIKGIISGKNKSILKIKY